MALRYCSSASLADWNSNPVVIVMSYEAATQMRSNTSPGRVNRPRYNVIPNLEKFSQRVGSSIRWN
jgi:hypothetical protein